ncbi:MAG: nuclear transport factor 2 family protein [Flavobacteriaceae bacterium]|nr:DUF4440 domain-containing protein [Bacteroidia bacterium]NNK87285.1 nuclear transport factor 2 family protein [Flavobacteriaceae bacterium]
MRLISVMIIALLFYSCQNKSKGLDQPGLVDKVKDEEILRYLKEVEWPRAYREQDTVLLDRILGDDFQMVTNDGEWSNKRLQMERIKSGPTDNDSFKFEIKRLEVFDNGTAIVGGTGHIWTDSLYHIYQSSNILIKRDSLWKAVLSHVSGYKKVTVSR